MFSRSAMSFTGGGSTVDRERPTGRSGCVTTPTTSKPSPISARSGGAANSGVPQKSTRIHSSSSRWWCAATSAGVSRRMSPGYFSFSFVHLASALRRLSTLRWSMNSVPCR